MFKGVVFDMDGTLTIPQLDFGKIREELGIVSGDIARELDSRPEPERSAGWALIERYENELIERNCLQDGVAEALTKFRKAGVRLGILTRNSSRSVEHFLERFGLDFDCHLGRDFKAIKPDPAPLLHIIGKWGLEPGECLMVGDYIHDIECGRAAGTRTCFFHNDGYESFAAHADYSVRSYAELELVVLS